MIESNLKFPEELNVDYDLLLNKLADDIRASLKTAPVDTGKLRQSIQVKWVDYSLTIEMLEYGYYQSFGVDGRKNKRAIGLTEGVASKFGIPIGSTFKSNKSFGLSPRKFYPLDIEERLIEILTKEL